jgi:hypothetical protein
MNQESKELVRVGDGNARILRVTPALIDYTDIAGQARLIDLRECAGNWRRFHDANRHDFIIVPGSSEAEADARNSRCVGERGALDDPPWVEFMNDRRTRFEFQTYEAVYGELLGPLAKNGWETFDTD